MFTSAPFHLISTGQQAQHTHGARTMFVQRVLDEGDDRRHSEQRTHIHAHLLHCTQDISSGERERDSCIVPLTRFVCIRSRRLVLFVIHRTQFVQDSSKKKDFANGMLHPCLSRWWIRIEMFCVQHTIDSSYKSCPRTSRFCWTKRNSARIYRCNSRKMSLPSIITGLSLRPHGQSRSSWRIMMISSSSKCSFPQWFPPFIEPPSFIFPNKTFWKRTKRASSSNKNYLNCTSLSRVRVTKHHRFV